MGKLMGASNLREGVRAECEIGMSKLEAAEKK